jgi:prepilin-type N-terminal cleavage/methylation domain-containing protein
MMELTMLRSRKSNPDRRNSQRGMSMVELLLAMVILVTGMAALLGLIITSISNNSRTRKDTAGTLAAQMVLETISAQPSPTVLAITDCAGNSLSVNTTGAASPGAGATINAAGNIDFTQTYAATPSQYKMQYTSCGAAGTQVVYDVRWNITTLTTYSKMVTVSARPFGAQAAGNTGNAARLFQQPVTLKTIAVQGN